MIDLILTAAGVGAGALVTASYDSVKERLRFRRELKDNNKINLAGSDWIAA